MRSLKLGERSRRSTVARVMLATGSVLALAAPAAVRAQEAQIAPPAAAADDASASDTAGEIIVTGSRLMRKDADSVGPVLTLTSADIAKSGSVTVGDLLQKLPSAGVSLNSNGTQGTSYGASSINLRYLGGAEGSGNRVLVLVDGHRWVDAVGQRGFRDFVDLNTIPMGMIDGIEVLKDGASAIYGADAIAGVVNIKTIQPFTGVRASGRSGITDRGDGGEYSGVLNVGKKWDRASILLSGSYYQARPIRTDARALTETTLVPLTKVGTNPNGLFVLPGLGGNAYFGTAPGFGSSSNPIVFNGGDTYGAGALADDSYHVGGLPGDYYNTQAQGIYSAGPSKRYGIYGRFDYAITDSINFRVEGLYNRRKSDQLFSPVLLDIGGSTGKVRGFSIPADQAFNPFGTANGVPAADALAFGAGSKWQIRKVMTDLGNRDNLQDVKTTRIAAGLNGDFTLLGNEWHWDAYGAYSKNKIDSTALNGINYDNLYLGLGSPAACAAAAGCMPIDLFAPMTAGQADYIRFTTRESNFTELYDGTINATGNLFDLPAGPVGLAVGYEYRHNRGVDHPDVVANTPSQYLSADYDKTTAQTRTPTSGSYSLNEVYAELAVPILRNQPLAKSLEVNLAARYSDYSTVGHKVTMKAGVGYRPVEGLLFRGTYSQGFRAPSILEIYQGARATDFQGVDPCNGGAAANPDLPGCAGVPAGYNQINYNGNGLIPGIIAGNRHLKPETADTYSLGVALTPRALPGLSLTVDYYKIVIRDAIASQTATQILDLCAQRGGEFCDLVKRDTGTGEVLELLQGAQNLNSIKTDGVDATLRYDLRTDTAGRFGFMVNASYLNSFKTTSPDPQGGAPIVDERAGTGSAPRATYPHWKGQASLSWGLAPFDAVLRARYIGPSTDIDNPVKDSRTKSVIYTDAEIGTDIAGGEAHMALGVNNLFDTQPPASYANAPINYDIYTYDARGRFLYARFSISM